MAAVALPGRASPGPASDSAQEARTATVGSPRSALAFPSVWLHPERAPTTAQEQRASLRLQVAGAGWNARYLALSVRFRGGLPEAETVLERL